MNSIALLAFTLTFTIILECGFAAVFFNIRSKDKILVVVLAQVLTNPVVEGFCGIVIPTLLVLNNIVSPTYEIISYISIAIFEIAAFIVEGIVYKKFNFTHPFIMSAVLNIISFSTGLIMTSII